MPLLIAVPTIKKAGSVGSRSVTLPNVALNPHQSAVCEKEADGKTRWRAEGTCPAKPGSTGTIPYARIAATIVFWSAAC